MRRIGPRSIHITKTRTGVASVCQNNILVGVVVIWGKKTLNVVGSVYIFSGLIGDRTLNGSRKVF